MLHHWFAYKMWCERMVAIFAVIAMIMVLFGDSKRMRGHRHSSISGCSGDLP